MRALHLEERLAVGEAEAARVALHGAPLGFLAQRLQLAAGPVAEVALEQPALGGDLQVTSLGDGPGGLARALEGRGVDTASTLGSAAMRSADRLRLGPALVGQVEAARAAGQPVAGGRRLPVADEQDERRRRRLARGSRHGPTQPTLSLRGSRLARARHRRGRRVRRVPAPRGLARGSGARQAGRVPRRGLLGPARARLRRPARRRCCVVGLAPAAHGGNRTGRVFTGDRSGDWVFRALHRAGYANQPTSEHRDDGLRLRGAYVAAAVRCAPPANKPTPAERDTCVPFLARELALLTDAAGDRRAGPVRLRRGGPPARRAAPAALRPRRRGRGRPTAARSSARSTRASRTPSPASSPSRCSTPSSRAPVTLELTPRR